MIAMFMGPSCSGKNSLIDSLCAYYPDNFERVVRITTRAPRPDEVSGRDYEFVSIDAFNGLICAHELAEYEEYSGGRFYGTSLKSLEPDGKHLCMTITPSGLLQLCLNGCDFGDIFVVYCESPLHKRLNRYISRLGGSYTIEDKKEMSDRFARDEGMFKCVDIVLKAAEKLYCGSLSSITLDTSKSIEDSFSEVLPLIKSMAFQSLGSNKDTVDLLADVLDSCNVDYYTKVKIIDRFVDRI